MSLFASRTTLSAYHSWARFAPLIILYVLALCYDVEARSIPIPGEDACPVACEISGGNPGNWTVYSDVDRLSACNSTMLLDFAVYTPFDDPSKLTALRACTATQSTAIARSLSTKRLALPRGRAGDADQTDTSTPAQLVWWNSDQSADTANIVDGANQAHAFLTANTGTSLLFVSHDNEAVGVFAGARVKDAILNSSVMSSFLDRVISGGVSRSLLAQVCGPERGGDFTFGIVATTGASKLTLVQHAVASWANGSCVTGGNGAASLGNVTAPLPPPSKVTAQNPSRVGRRGLCRTTTVASGDGCYSLSVKCGITLAQFQADNPGSSFCSSLQPSQIVCCSSGSLPTPTPKPDGSCASYLVQSGDYCAKIAAANAITTANIEAWNTGTWGWTGCNNLRAGVNMCLSTGRPPMPAPITNALCGPQVPGTVQPPAGTNLSSLNPCPLNACCDIWGQCGTTTEFCTPSGTGPPGTAAPGTNGCISNCGTKIVVGSPPASVMKVAYFEGWNSQRPCLQMDVSQVDKTAYTHLHFGFASLANGTYNVDITSDIQSQFTNFLNLNTSMKKILSFGGWTFSTAPFDFSIFRTGMTAAHRDGMATGIANFIVNNHLDGVDIDWEYPGAPDIPGIPPGSPTDGPNYLAFLKSLRSKLPTGKTISIAAPASYWYLQHFPIVQMSLVVDYIVYMTYDLHGQWDYGNANSDPGCPGGNCLRSHVNLTETINALSMITKAGVPTNKIVVGVSSYGRSFQMTTPGCTGPMCTYTGPTSGAQPAPCTKTAGYIANAEINSLINVNNPGLQQIYDAGSDSNILVYASNQWVAYMSDATKKSRTSLYLGYNFAGTSDWAVDLQKLYPPTNSTTPNPDLNGYGAVDPTIQYCTDAQAQILRQTWIDAGTMAKLHMQWSPKGKWQNVMDLYMGNGSQNDYPISHDYDYGPIGSNIQGEYLIHFAWTGNSPFWTYGWFYCGDADLNIPSDEKICQGDNPPIAYSWDEPGWFWSGHYIVFCDSFFTTGISLADITTKADGNINFQQTLTNFYDVQANTLLHETYHWSRTVSNPRCQDYAYPSQDVADLAYWKGSDVARLNAESFADCAMSIYIMDKWGRNTPPTPNGGAYVPGKPPGTLTAATNDALPAPPAGWTSPVNVNSATFTWDPSLNVIVMSKLGDTQDDSTKSMECLEGSQFLTLMQCNIFCPFATCSPSVDSAGHTWYQCLACPGPIGCVNGNYVDVLECQRSCNGGSCTRTPGYMTVVCSGCGANVCTPGTYSNFNTCSASCFQGQCAENAGQPGVICSC